MSNIVGLRGDPVLAIGEPHPDVVKETEKLLALAQSGEISGIQAIVVHRDGCSSLLRAGTTTYSQVGMLMAAAHEVLEILRADE